MNFNTKPYEEKMTKAIAAYEQNLAIIRAGQANTAVLSKITFEYWGLRNAAGAAYGYPYW